MLKKRFVPAPATHPRSVALKQSLRPDASSAAWFLSFRSTMPSLFLAPSEGGRSDPQCLAIAAGHPRQAIDGRQCRDERDRARQARRVR